MLKKSEDSDGSEAEDCIIEDTQGILQKKNSLVEDLHGKNKGRKMSKTGVHQPPILKENMYDQKHLLQTHKDDQARFNKRVELYKVCKYNVDLNSLKFGL